MSTRPGVKLNKGGHTTRRTARSTKPAVWVLFHTWEKNLLKNKYTKNFLWTYNEFDEDLK